MSAAPMPIAPVFDLNSTVGAVEIGVLISIFLFGVVSCQVWVYYRKFPTDITVLKLLVAIIWLMELGHTVSVSHSLYTITVLDLGNPLKLLSAPKSLDISILFCAFIGPLVQAWFAYRVLKLSGTLFVPILCWCLSFLRGGATIAVGVEALMSTSILQFETDFKWLLTSILAVGAAVDVIIAASLCYFLRQHRATSFQRTVKVINQMMIWTVETGFVTSVGAVAMLICFLFMQDNFVWIAIFTFLAKLFSNSLLVALNARNVKRDPETEHNASTFLDAVPSMHRSPTASRDRKSFVPPSYPNLTIEMSRTTEVKHDEPPMDEWYGYGYAV